MEPMDKQLLFQVMSQQSESRNQRRMLKFIRRTAWKLGATSVTQDEKGNLYVTKGEADLYPCVVAHTDTVHRIVPNDQFQILSHDGTWFAFDPLLRKSRGIGGDDKVGIFIALAALKQFEAIKLAFFVDEEIGCQGSSRADMTFFDNASLVLQCDRRGYGEVVKEISYTELFGLEFELAIKPYMDLYGMATTDWGGITDVGELKENGLKVACTNIACGYYLPHTDQEYINLEHVQKTMNFVFDVIGNLGDMKWDHEYTYTPRTYRYYGNSSRWGSSDAWSSSYKSSKQSTTSQPTSIGRLEVPGMPAEQWPFSWEINGRYYGNWSRCPLCEEADLEWTPTDLDFYCRCCGYMVTESVKFVANGEAQEALALSLAPPAKKEEEEQPLDAIPESLVKYGIDSEQIANDKVDEIYEMMQTHDTKEEVQAALDRIVDKNKNRNRSRALVRVGS